MLTERQIDGLFRWGPWEIITTKQLKQKKVRRKKACDTDIRNFHANKLDLTSAGVQLQEFPPLSGKYQLAQWRDPETDEVQRYKLAEKLSDSTESHLVVPSPPGLNFMPFQMASIHFFLNGLGVDCSKLIEGAEPHPKAFPGLFGMPMIPIEPRRTGFLLADEMGLGKSVQAVGLINAFNALGGGKKVGRILYVCPADLKLNAARELGRWLTHKYSIGIADGQVFPSADIVIINYQILHKWEHRLSQMWDLMIVDECHFLKNSKARQTQAAYGSNLDGVRKAGIPAKIRVAMSGTPIENRPREFWETLHWLDPISWGDKGRFEYRYCGGGGGTGWNTKGSSYEAELQHKLRTTCLTGESEVLSQYGPIKIRDIVRGKLPIKVWSRDSVGGLSIKSVVGFSETENREVLVRIVHEAGCITCTESHRIYVGSGWKRAGLVKVGDELLSMREVDCENICSNERQASVNRKPSVLFTSLLWEAKGDRQKGTAGPVGGGKEKVVGKNLRGLPKNIHVPEREGCESSSVLQFQLSWKVGIPKVLGGCDCYQGGEGKGVFKEEGKASSRYIGAIEGSDCSSKSGGGDEDFSVGKVEKNPSVWGYGEDCETATSLPKHVDAQKDLSAQDAGGSIGDTGGDDGCDDRGWKHSDLCRCENREFGNRSGWAHSRDVGSEETRQTEGFVSEKSRVLSVEVLELGNRRESSGCAEEDRFVYDIEVEGNHNYFASGALVHNCMVRRLKKDVMKELPPKRREVILLPNKEELNLEFDTEEMRSWADRMARARAKVEWMKSLEDQAQYDAAVQELQDAVDSGQAASSKARQAAAHAKIPLVVPVLLDAAETIGKIIVFAYHREVIDRLAKELPGSLVIYGGIDPAKRDEMVQRFQNDPTVTTIIISIPVAVGMTLTAASHEYFVEGDWRPGKIAQAEDRAHRIGQKDSVNVYHFVLENSVDVVMIDNVLRKQAMIDAVLDEDATKGREKNEPVIPVPGFSTTFKEVAVESLKITNFYAEVAEVQEQCKEALQVWHGLTEFVLLDGFLRVSKPWPKLLALLKLLLRSIGAPKRIQAPPVTVSIPRRDTGSPGSKGSQVEMTLA